VWTFKFELKIRLQFLFERSQRGQGARCEDYRSGICHLQLFKTKSRVETLEAEDSLSLKLFALAVFILSWFGVVVIVDKHVKIVSLTFLLL
jgi:hypothetical protein